MWRAGRSDFLSAIGSASKIKVVFDEASRQGGGIEHTAENGVKIGAGVNVLQDAIALVDERVVASVAA